MTVAYRTICRQMGALTLCFAALLSVAACSGFSSDNTRYEPVPLTDYEPSLTVRERWSTPVGKGGGLGFIPTVVEDAVYAATPDGKVGKYELLNGSAVWQADAGVKLSAGVGSDGSTTAVATPRGQVIAFDEAGQVKWKAQATSEVTEPPVVGGGRVVVRSGDYRIQAFDAQNGEVVWSLQRPGPALALRASLQMTLVDGLLIAGLPGGKLMVINNDNGNVQWEEVVATPRGGSDLERLNDVVGMPQFVGPLLCAASYQGRIACFDVSQGGRTAWAKKFSSTTGLVANQHAIYAADHHSVIHAFSLQDGASLWEQMQLRNRQVTSPAVLDEEALAVGDYEGYVHFLARNDGHLLARLAVGGGVIVAPLQTTAQGVVVQTGKGKLILIGKD